MSSTASNPVLEFRRRKRTRSNISVFTLPTSLPKRPHIEDISESALPAIEVTAPTERGASAQAEVDTETTSSSSASSDAESSSSEDSSEEEASGDESDASDTLHALDVQYPPVPGSSQDGGGDLSESDEETSSSSDSSSSSGDSQSRSPSPTPALPSLRNIGETLPLDDAGPQTHLTAPSSLSRRLKEFLPAMRSANEDLELERAKGTLNAKNIENLGEDGSKEPGRYIEMDLGLGVLQGRPGDGSDSDSDDGSQHSSEITDPMDRSDEGVPLPAEIKHGKEEDVMGKLRGEPRRERPDIKVVEDTG